MKTVNVIVCPYCNKEYNLKKRINWENKQGKTITICNNCNKEFILWDTMIYEKIGGLKPNPSIPRYAPDFEYMFILSKGKR